jgi:hypothetical protein
MLILKTSLAASHPYVTLVLAFPVALAASLAATITLFVLVERRFSVRPKRKVFAAQPTRERIEGIGARDLRVVKDARIPASEVVLSVIIPCFNTAAYVVAAVNSVLAQTFGRFEVIVVDDGSDDDCEREFARISDPRVRIVAQRNRGLAGARNTGILLARGKFIGFLDSDDLWCPEKAQRQVAIMDANPEIGVTFSYSAYMSEDGALTDQLLISSCKEPNAKDLALRNHIGNGSTPIIRRECFEDAGLFAESLRSCEDYEMWVRIAACTRWKVRLVPEVLTRYRVRAGSMSTSFETFTSQARIAIESIKGYLPSLSSRDAARCYAETLRIASRKALSGGNVQLSRAMLIEALRHCPWLPAVDLRAMGTLLIHIFVLPMPERIAIHIYELVCGTLRASYRALNFYLKLQARRREQ